MRRIAWMLLLLFVFTIPWEYSLDLGARWGNIARLTGLVLLVVMVPAVLQSRRIRPLRSFHALVLLWLLWLSFSVFWSLDARSTAEHLSGYLQEMMIVWLLWELIESEADLRAILRAYVAGVTVLALLTLASFLHPQSPDQVRFVPEGQDPNDVARFLVMGLPFAAWLANASRKRWRQTLALASLSLATFAILLTASRSGSLACALSLIGCAALLWPKHRRLVIAAVVATPLALVAFWLVTPHETLLRLAGIPDQLLAGDLNQRWNIWQAGWSAFARAPFTGWGAASFVAASGTAAIDTAHNTPLAIAVEGGLISLGLACVILASCVRALLRVERSLRLALGTALLSWMFLSPVSDVQESRTTWLLLGIVFVASRFGECHAVVISAPAARSVRSSSTEAAEA